MNLQSNTPEFVESFCEQCLDRGLDPKTASSLLFATRLEEGARDPDFADGFRKRAAAPLLGKVLGGAATAVGAAAGGAALGGRNPLHHLSGMTSGWGWDRRVHTPYWLGAAGQAPAPARQNRNAFQHIDGFALPGNRPTTQTGTGPLAEARAARARLQALDQQAQAVRGRNTGTGLEGTLGERARTRELRDLDRERQRLQRSMVGAYYGGFKGDVNRASRSIAAREQQLMGRRGKLDRASTNLQTALAGDAPWYARPWEFLTGAEGRASKVLSSQRQLDSELKQLEDIRRRLREAS